MTYFESGLLFISAIGFIYFCIKYCKLHNQQQALYSLIRDKHHTDAFIGSVFVYATPQQFRLSTDDVPTCYSLCNAIIKRLITYGISGINIAAGFSGSSHALLLYWALKFYVSEELLDIDTSLVDKRIWAKMAMIATYYFQENGAVAKRYKLSEATIKMYQEYIMEELQ